MAASVRLGPMRCSQVAIDGETKGLLLSVLGGCLVGSLVGWEFKVVFEFAKCEKICEVWRLLRVVCWVGLDLDEVLGEEKDGTGTRRACFRRLARRDWR